MAYEDITRAPAPQGYGPLDLGIYPHLAPLVQNLAANLRAARQQQQDDEQATLAAEAKKVAEARRQSEADRAEEKFGLEYGQEVDVQQAGPVRPGEVMPTVTKRTQGLRQTEAESKVTSRSEDARLSQGRLDLAERVAKFERERNDEKKAADEEEKYERGLEKTYNTAFQQGPGLVSKALDFKYDPNNPTMKLEQKRAWDIVVAADKRHNLKRLRGLDKKRLEAFLESRDSHGMATKYALYLLRNM